MFLASQQWSCTAGIGYDRVAVVPETPEGPVEAVAYIGLPDFFNDARLPTRRYLNILVRGAVAAGLDETYVRGLNLLPVLPAPELPTYVPPVADAPVFTADSLARCPLVTAIAGSVFDVSGARPRHDLLKSWFGGKDVTLFHLKRLDASDGSETEAHLREGRLDANQRHYLNTYLHAFDHENNYVGRYTWD